MGKLVRCSNCGSVFSEEDFDNHKCMVRKWSMKEHKYTLVGISEHNRVKQDWVKTLGEEVEQV